MNMIISKANYFYNRQIEDLFMKLYIILYNFINNRKRGLLSWKRFRKKKIVLVVFKLCYRTYLSCVSRYDFLRYELTNNFFAKRFDEIVGPLINSKLDYTSILNDS